MAWLFLSGSYCYCLALKVVLSDKVMMVLMHVMNVLFSGEEASDVMTLLLVGSTVFNENIHDDNIGEMSLLFCVLKLSL